MALNTRFYTSRPQSFVVGPDEIKKLCSVLSERIGAAQITFRCTDDVTREFGDVTSAIAFENSRARAIRSILLMARSSEYDRSASIEFDGAGSSRVVLSISTEEGVLSHLKLSLFEIIDGTRPWYWFLHRIDFSLLGPLLLFLGWFALLIMISVDETTATAPARPSAQREALMQLIAYGVPLLLLTLGIAVNGLRNKIFPAAVFKIGQGESRLRTREQFQWGFIIAFIVSLVASIIVAVLQ